MFVLIRCVPQESGPSWNRYCGRNRQVVRPGQEFTGREGRMGPAHDPQRTGWYEPVYWEPVEEAAALLHESRWGGESDDLADWLAEARALAAGPGEYPGLAEHYPAVAAAYPAVAAEAPL